MSRVYWLILLSAITLLPNCASPPAPVATPSPAASSDVAAQPVATAEPTQAPSFTPTPTQAFTPTPTREPTLTPTAIIAATDTAVAAEPEADIFTVYANQAVVPHGPAGAWDGQFTDPGAIVYHDGLFHMFHNGFVGWPSSVGIAYSNSADGYTWTRVTDEPVFRGDDLDYAGLTVLASSALVEEDGTWVLYFYTWEAETWPAPGAIGRATAPEPTGPWVADPAPVLQPGSAGAWDSYAVRAPSVVRVDDGYVMFYAGYSQQQAMIGMATSADGLNWTKYDDPATTETLFSESDPVFGPGEDGSWDSRHVFQPRVQQSPDGFVMLYSAAAQVNGRGSRLGYAISPDGLNWMRSDEPILEASAVPGGVAIWYTELLYQDNTYFLFFELGTGGMTEVYLAIHEGLLTP